MNLLIYRAKAKNSSRYIIGWFFKTSKGAYIIPIAPYYTYIEVQEETLAMHHPDMLDIENNKIFASLNPDGIGGDICFNKCTEKYETMIFDSIETIPYFSCWFDYKVNKIKEI